MQNRQGYCSFCSMRYNNLEQHMSNPQHRYMTTHSRQRMGSSSLMERFLQDVLRHHPYHYQESRSRQNERTHRNNVPPSEVVPADDPVSDEMAAAAAAAAAAGVRGEIASGSFEPAAELYARPQECMQGVLIRPSVIQKLEKGQQLPLELVYKIGSGMREFNPIGIGQATNKGQNLLCPSVISTAPASNVPESSYDRPVTSNTTGLPAASLESVIKCEPNKVDSYLEQGRGSRNPMFLSHPEMSSVVYQEPKEPNRKSVRFDSDKLVTQENVKSRDKTLSPGFKSHAFMGTEGSLKFESLSKSAVNPAINLSKTDMPSNKGNFEDAIPKHHVKFFSNTDRTQEEKHLVLNKSAFVEQKSSVCSKMEFACGYSESVSGQPEETVKDLWSEERIDQEVKTYESRGSEMSFDCSSPFHPLTDQSKGTAKETNLLKEAHVDVQHKSNKSCVSEISFDREGPVQLSTNQTQVIVRGSDVQKAEHIRLVDESYDSSDSEMNFECNTSPQSTDNYHQQPVKEIGLSKEAHIDLVDKNYGSSSSEISADSLLPFQSVIDQLPMAVTETELQKKVPIGLVDVNYGSSCSETSFDCDVALPSVIVHPQQAVRGRNLKDRLVYLKDNHKSSSAKAHLDYGNSLQIVTDQPKTAVEEINLKEKNDLMDMSCEYYVPEMSFHTDAQLVADQPQVTVREVAIGLQNKNVNTSDSDPTFNSHASLYQSNNGQPHGTLSEMTLKELNVDMEVKSYGHSSSDLTFDSDPPHPSVPEPSELDVEDVRKKHNLERESCGSNSSEITFDSDIPFCPVDQPRVVEEGSVDQKYKGHKSCVSETPFDSDVPLPLGTAQPEVAVREVIIQKEDYAHLRRKNDEPSVSERSLNSYVTPLPVMNSPGVLVERPNLQKEQVYFESKRNEPSGSELSLNYDSFYSIIGHSADSIKEGNLQKEEHIENKRDGRGVPEISSGSYISHVATDHPDTAVKDINRLKEERANFQDKGNELSVSETSLDFAIPLQSVIHRTDVVLKEMWLQREKHANFKGKSAEFSGSEINLDSDVSRYSVIEPQIAVKGVNIQKEYVLENKNDKYSGSEIILDSTVLPQSMTEKPHIAVLKKDHVDPEDENTESRGFEINLDRIPPRQSVIEKSQPTPLKERHTNLEYTSSESRDCKVNFDSADPLQPLTERYQEVIKKTNLWKVEDIGLENKGGQPNDSMLILQDSHVSLQSIPNQPQAAVKQINLDNEGHMDLEDNNSQYSGSDMSLDSDFLAQQTVDQSQVTILEKEHTNLEDKHKKSCGSEISFDSDDPLQSVADQVRETVKEISLWKDEVDVEEKSGNPKGFEIMYGSDVFQPVTGQTEEIVQETNLWKNPGELEGKIFEPSDSKINFGSAENFHTVAGEIQESTTEISLLREGHVCLHDKDYQPSDPEIIYVANIPLQSVEQPHILEEGHDTLGDKSNDLCHPEISFASDDPLQSVTDQLEKTVKVGLWKGDHIYLGDESYKLADYEISCDSEAPVQLVVAPSPVVVQRISLQKEDHNDLEGKNCEPSVAEIKCDPGVHLQLDVGQPQMFCKEMNLPRVAHLGMEEKTSDSEIMSDSDVPLQIVVNEFPVSVKEADVPKVLFLNVVTGDSDCEMPSNSGFPCQPVIDTSQMTVEGIDCMNGKSFHVEGQCYDCCDSERGYVCEASPRPVSKKSRKSYKVINKKKDYIILEESGCESYDSDTNFQVNASHQSMTYQSPVSVKTVAKHVDPEVKSCVSKSSKRNSKRRDTSQPATRQLKKANKEDDIWKDPKTIDLQGKSCECNISAMDCNASPESVILQMADEDNLLKLKKHADLGSVSCEPSSSGVNFHSDPPLQSGTNKPQKAVKKQALVKMPLDKKKKNRDSRSSSVSKVASLRNREKAKGIKEVKTDEPVLEALPHVPPSFVGKTWSQIMREDDMKINALVKEFKEGRFHCYFDDDCETRKVKKKNLNEKKITSADLNDTAFIQVLLDCHYNIDDFSVALDKPSHLLTEKRPYEQKWRVSSRCRAVKVSHGTQTSVTGYLVTKRVIGQEDSPKLKHLFLHNDRKPKRKIEIGTIEFLESYTNILKPLHPNALVYVLSSNIKQKEGESLKFSKIRCQNGKNNQDLSIQYKYKQGSFNYDPLNKQIVINPPLNIEIPESDRNNWVQVHFSDLNSSAEDDDRHLQSSTSVPFLTVSLRHKLSHQGASGASVFLAKSEILNSREVQKLSNFHFTLLDGDAAKISSKSGRNKTFKSKKKAQRRKVTTINEPIVLKMVYRPIILQQKTRITSKKQPIWIRTKLNDIIRKYIAKYSVFLRRKYQSRRAFLGMHRKKTKTVVSTVKKVETPTQMLSNSVPSAGAEERLRGRKKRSSLKQRLKGSSRIAGTRRKGKKKLPKRKPKKRPKPVKIYDLRSLYSQVPYSDRMMTRLLHKLLLNKAN
ncbi:DBF4-type zinc finger-containing protein 2 [Saccopteryx leptura]|uniref:DBF4-type zinc finger-containing protein 2 n=1 Tax=Saccopteryx leptura TaxID=249018 RepID=UPI00339CBDE7